MKWKVFFWNGEETTPPNKLQILLLTKNIHPTYSILLSEYMNKDGRKLLDYLEKKEVSLNIYVEREKLFYQLSFLSKFKDVDYGGVVFSPYEFYMLRREERKKLPPQLTSSLISIFIKLERLVWIGNWKFMENILKYDFKNHEIINLSLLLSDCVFLDSGRKKKVSRLEL
jgi:hypothetical protein